MKKRIASLLLALVLCLGLTVSAAAAEEQKITVGDKTYGALLEAIMSETKTDSVTARLDSDVTLTAAVVIGSSDYNGQFKEPMTVTAKNVTIDLNGHTLTAAKDCAVFEVQKDYTLTIVDGSEAKTGKLDCGAEEAVVVAEGAGSAIDIGRRIHEEVGIDPRVTVLGHIQRGGSPTARDRETASRMGYEAVLSLIEDRGNRIICTHDGRIVDLDMEEALAMTKQFQMDRYQVLEALANTGGMQ